MNFIKRKIIKALMKTFPVVPEASDLSLSEIFNHTNFVGADESSKRKLMLNSAQWRYDYEEKYPLEETYFKKLNLKKLLENKIVLDLGCFTGGRSTAWTQHYNVKKMYGIDVDNIFIESARLFSQKMETNTHFQVAYGEELPFKDIFFDTIITFDVFEHVRNIKTVLCECWRVLKEDGVLICSFPQYLSPFEHHLSLVTKTPCLHWFFSTKNLMEIYNEIIEERGPDAKWYKRPQFNLRTWEKLGTINGTSIKEFRKMIKESGWQIYFQNVIPIFTTGRLFNKYLIFKLLSIFFKIFAGFPYLEELFSERIVYILQKSKQNVK